jgi:hypothetical protein
MSNKVQRKRFQRLASKFIKWKVKDFPDIFLSDEDQDKEKESEKGIEMENMNEVGR